MVAVGLATYIGCAAGPGASNATSSGGAGAADSVAVGQGGGGGSIPSQGGSTSTADSGAGGFGITVGVGGSGGAETCAQFTVETQLDPAAMVVVLDGSRSMGESNKWAYAKNAIIKALDKDVFDSMSVGLVAFPEGFVDPPACLCAPLITTLEALYGAGYCTTNNCCSALPQVSCGSPVALQIPIQLAGPNKSITSPGVRYDTQQFLDSKAPLNNLDDGSPIYEALEIGYAELKNYANVDDRMLVLVTDGGFSCTSMSSRDGYEDASGCTDWEYPDSVNQLMADALDGGGAGGGGGTGGAGGSQSTGAAMPIRTFVVGVPGSNTNPAGGPGSDPNLPPYSMLLALSTYAVSGSPDTVPATCDSSAVFSQTAAAPAKPCHFDLSNGQMFNADALATAIAEIRGQAFGCVYPMPDPPVGETIDLDKVNVKLTIESVSTTVPKRSVPTDTCENAGCWDYQGPDNDIELIGKACTDASNASTAKVEIEAGCATILN